MEAKEISEALKNAMQDGNNDTPAQETVSGGQANASPEQWKSGGHCEMCRREKYCGTECKARRMRKALQAERDALQIMLEAFKKAEGEDGNVDANKEEEEEHNDQG